VLLDCARLASEVGARRWFDPRYWHLAKQAVSPACVPLLARHLGAVIAAALGLAKKCLVLDLDNTLWGGVLGEEGIDGLQIGEGTEGEAYAAFQDYVAALEARGVVLAVCSKNDEHLVREAFARRHGMRLRLEQFAAVSAGWDDKPTQLRRLASDLGLGLDSLVFCDDNPIEREAVRRLVPEIDVIRLPTDPAGYVEALATYPYLESTRLTDDDTRRTEQYRARSAAAAARGTSSSLEEFLDGLGQEATVELVGPPNLARVAQLVGKSNQFNLTSRRRTEAELAELADRPEVVALAVRLRDRFADHGLVGVLLAVDDGPALEIDTWLMSCRVIGRSLEALLLQVLARVARERGRSELRGSYIPTAKSSLVADLYPKLGFQLRADQPSDGSTRWVVAVDDVDVVPHIRLSEASQGTIDALTPALPAGNDLR
jgi:FkbH-like protein